MTSRQSFFDKNPHTGRNPTEVASGLAGTAVARQQSAVDSLSEARSLSIRDRIQDFLGLGSQGIKEHTPSVGAQGLVPRETGPDAPFSRQTADREIGNRFLTNTVPRVGLEALINIIPGLDDPLSVHIPDSIIPDIGFDTVSRVGEGISSSAAADAARASGIARANAARRGANEDILEGALQRFNQEQYAPYAAEIQRLQGEAGTVLDKLKDDLDKYKGGLAGVNKAYSDYAVDTDAILKQAAAVSAEALPETEVVAEHQRVYDEHDAQMQTALQRIDSSGSPELAQAMSEEVRYFEEVMEDGLRSGLVSQEELHNLAGAEAQALAHMAWKDDAYSAEKERYGLELEIQAKINQKAEDIADTQEQLARSQQAIRDSWQGTNLSAKETWNLAFGDLVKSKGFNEIETADLIDTFNSVFDPQYNPGASDAINNFDSFKGQIQYIQNLELLAELGASQTVLDSVADFPELENTLRSGWLRPETLSLYGLDEASFGPDGLQGAINKLKPETDLLLDSWQHYSDFNNNPDQFSQVDPTGFMGSEVAWNPEGNKAFPVLGFNWGSGGGFGYVKPSGRTHEGVDIGGYRGTPVVAPTQGVVVREGWNDMGGWTVTLKDDQGFTHYMAHLDQRSPLRVGHNINAGQYLGGVGTSGNASGTAPHVHYGMRDSNGRAVDPAPWLGSTGAWQIGDPPSDARTNVFTYNSKAPGGAVTAGDVRARLGIGL